MENYFYWFNFYGFHYKCLFKAPSFSKTFFLFEDYLMCC